MKYIFTGVDRATGQRIAARINCETTRKSKLLKRISQSFLKVMGKTIEDFDEIYIGKVDKHTK